MKRRISDMLDGYREDSVELTNSTPLSSERIKELTMKKVQKESKSKRRGMSSLVKIGLAAAIIASLAIPVMAATGFRFTDWLEGLERGYVETAIANDHSWENTEGFWQVALTAREVTEDGMTLAVKEVQDSEVTGSLTMQGGYRLERWDGAVFVPMAEATEVPAEASREIRDGDEFEMQVNWANVYGSLESGRYRLYKTFTYTFSDGKTMELEDWAEFRIFNEDMTPYIEQIKVALDALQKQGSSHISWSLGDYDVSTGSQNSHFDYEVWKNGGDYLLRLTFADLKDETEGGWGEMLCDGEGFEIRSWKDGDVLSGVEKWEYDNLLSEDLNSFEAWLFYASISDSNVGEVWVEGNRIGVLNVYYPEANNPTYTELVYTFDDQGGLVSAVKSRLTELYCAEEEKQVTFQMEVHDTSDAEIAQVLEAQNVGQPKSFSWEEEKAQYSAGTSGVKTSGFANTVPVTIGSGYDAFMHAFNDYEVVAGTHHASEVSYDAEADMWKVEFWWKNGNVDCIVYMNGQGVTQMTVMGPYEG